MTGVPTRILVAVTVPAGSEEAVVAAVAAAREQQADLVVVPMRQEGELRHLMHDHADRHVLHHSDVPVLVVPTHGRPSATHPTHGWAT
jgi:nucleotide-binding universal stress UspA family protein